MSAENSALKSYATVTGYAHKFGAKVTKVEPKNKVINGTKKLYFDVHYYFPEDDFTYVETYFTKNILTDADWKALEGKKLINLKVFWGRMKAEDEWGKGKVIEIHLEGGEVIEPQGPKDERPEWNNAIEAIDVAEGI